MKYNELEVRSTKAKRRVGRGIAAGQGKTAGRGTKGQGSRAGGGVRPGFEGGQNPLYARLPKLRGFRSPRPKAEVVYTGQLDEIKETVVDNTAAAKAGLVSSPHVKAKLVLKGDVTKKLTVKLQAASKGAVAAIEKAGGTFEKTAQLPRQKSKKSDK